MDAIDFFQNKININNLHYINPVTIFSPVDYQWHSTQSFRRKQSFVTSKLAYWDTATTTHYGAAIGSALLATW